MAKNNDVAVLHIIHNDNNFNFNFVTTKYIEPTWPKPGIIVPGVRCIFGFLDRTGQGSFKTDQDDVPQDNFLSFSVKHSQ